MNVKTELQQICGHRLCLRLVTPEDAAFIHQLRIDPVLNAHLSPVTGTARDQRDWIERYKTREAAGAELYYVIERRDGTPCGVVRLYDIQRHSFTWGSWILNGDKPPMAALESAVLSFGVGFEVLGLARAEFDARLDNARAIAFYRRFGAHEVKRDDLNIYFEYSGDQYAAARATRLDIIKGQTEA